MPKLLDLINVTMKLGSRKVTAFFVAFFLLVLPFLSPVSVSAHEDPVDCNASGLSQFPSVSPSGVVHDGDTLTYTVTYNNTDPDGGGPIAPCNITGADGTILLPDGSTINVITNVSLNVGDSISCPGDAACAAGPYTYDVIHGDEISSSVTAEFEVIGDLHQDGDEEIAQDFDTLSKTVIHPSTITTIISSSEEVITGSTVDLTITEQNDGDVALSSPWVDLQPLGLVLDDTHPSFVLASDNGNGILDVGETWQWIVTGIVVNSETDFVATGHGIDSSNGGGLDVTWCRNGAPEGVFCDAEERDNVRVDVLDPSTDVFLSVSAETVYEGDTVDLHIEEANDGDADLANAYVDLQPLGLVLDTSSIYFTLASDDGDGILEVGETWQWNVTGVVVNADETYTATGHGEILGFDVTFCEDPEQAPEGVLCDPDEQETVEVDVIDPTTATDITVDLSAIVLGDEVTLTITESNDGDVDLLDPHVNLEPLGLTLDETSPEFTGTDAGGDGILSPTEVWTWEVVDSPLVDTIYTATGHGTDPLGNDVTYCEDPESPPEGVVCDQEERDTVNVDLVNPSTTLSLSATATLIVAGDTTTLHIEEENDGDDDLANAYVEVDNGVGILDSTHPSLAGDDGDSVLEPGETWMWDVDVTPLADTTYVAIAHGTDSFGLDVTWCEDDQSPPEGVRCDQDEIARLLIEVEDPTCTLTQGYWKTHSEEGPAANPDATWELLPSGPDTDFFLSDMSWLEVFDTPVKGNSYYNLAHQYMAANLNQLSGASVPTEVQDALDDAADLFNTYTPVEVGDWKGSQGERQEFIDLAGILGSYNEGIIGPGHCEE